MMAHVPLMRSIMSHFEATGSRPLTEPELRVQRCLEDLQVPEWYKKRSKPPPKILRNGTPFECRPASWKIHQRGKPSPKKSKRRSPRSTPKKAPLITDFTWIPENDSGNESYSPSQKSFDHLEPPAILVTPPSPIMERASPEPVATEPPIQPIASTPQPPPFRGSNTFPRVSRSRRVANLNIVLPKRKPAPPSSPKPSNTSTPKTLYTVTKHIELQPAKVISVANPELNDGKNHVSFLVANVKPDGVTTRIRVFAGTDDEKEVEEVEEHEGLKGKTRLTTLEFSPSRRFFHAKKKSTELERIVQSRLAPGKSSLIQDIIGELDRSVAEARAYIGKPLSYSRECHYPDILEEEEEEEEEEEHRCSSSNSMDSDIAKSTSISFNSGDEQHALSEPESDEPDVYWVPCKDTFNLLRSSTRLSLLSDSRYSFGCSSSYGNISNERTSSPELSPIKRMPQEDWGRTYCVSRGSGKASRQLFKIDETGPDSGYSDSAASSRTATLSSRNRNSGSGSFLSEVFSALSTSPYSSEYSSEHSDISERRQIGRERFMTNLQSRPEPAKLRSILV